MKCVIFANGEYGDLNIYKQFFQERDIFICADGGANYAHELNIIPAYIVGDMDSISPEIRAYYEQKKVSIRKYPRRKDFTDTQLAISMAREMGADEIWLLGSLGKRLDHTLSNLYLGMDLVREGIRITHLTPDGFVYIVSNEIEIEGTKGDIVSVLPLTEEAIGVNEQGFEYTLQSVILEQKNPYAVSNVLAGDRGKITLEEGILAVFHYVNFSS